MFRVNVKIKVFPNLKPSSIPIGQNLKLITSDLMKVLKLTKKISC